MTSGALGGVRALFDLHSATIGPFPADQFTIPDGTQLTGIRINLPKPDCTIQVSDCEDIDILNTLDGFNMQPRLTLSFDGPISVNTVSSNTVTLVKFADGAPPRKIGINQIVWDPDENRLYVQSDELLDQHAHFALVATNGILDSNGDAVLPAADFLEFIANGSGDYHRKLLSALQAASDVGIPATNIVTASEFTTISATAVMEKIRDQIKAAVPSPASFVANGIRTVFSRDDVASIVWHKQDEVTPPHFTDQTLQLSPLDYFGAFVGTIAFGTFTSNNYETPQMYIPPIGTLTGIPEGEPITLPFDLFLPVGCAPPQGWPVAIFGHGGQASKEGAIGIASKMAQHGIATVAINIPGHGFGPLSTLEVTLTNGQHVIVPSPGRGVDLDGDNMIGNNEGLEPLRPYLILRTQDALRQETADLMQLVREIQVGMDVDGEGNPDLDASQIYYVGLSLGSAVATDFLALEPDVRVGVVNNGNGVRSEAQRLSPGNRSNEGSRLQERIPFLINSPGLTELAGVPVAPPFFNENIPFRNQPPVVNNVSGAIAIQEVFDRATWAQMNGNPVAYAPYIRKHPLPGSPAKQVIIQLAKGDQNVPNLSTTMVLRAGDLADATSYYRHDLAYADNPTLPKNPHTFLLSLSISSTAPIGAAMQEQIAIFFETGGTTIIHPDPEQYWEVPISPPLPETLFFIP